MKTLKTKTSNGNSVTAYISNAPKEARAKLKAMRRIMKEVAPDAAESISYGMPGYDKGRVAWFALMKGYIGLYVRPPIIAEHKKELAKYKTTKSAVHFPLEDKLPVALIKKLVRARIKKNFIPHTSSQSVRGFARARK